MEEYIQGFDVTQNLQYQAHQCVIDAYEMGLKNGIEQGRNEAWEAAVSIAKAPNGMLHSMGFIVNHANNAAINSCFTIQRYTASEAIEKIKAWEEKKMEDDNIEIGDEVYVSGKNYIKVVIDIIDDRSCRCLSFTGTSVYLIEDLHKTGRHFAEISEILEKMKNGE